VIAEHFEAPSHMPEEKSCPSTNLNSAGNKQYTTAVSSLRAEKKGIKRKGRAWGAGAGRAMDELVRNGLY